MWWGAHHGRAARSTPAGWEEPDMAHAVDVHVGAHLRLQRMERGLSQTAVAEKVGLTFQQIQKYESGGNRISASTLFELAKFLDIPIWAFFNGLGESGKSASATKPAATALDLEIVRLLSVSDEGLKQRIFQLLGALQRANASKKAAGKRSAR
jgi:transcriptional regulator with XRE-family HTH domain